jgi:hypothetical protein
VLGGAELRRAVTALGRRLVRAAGQSGELAARAVR